MRSKLSKRRKLGDAACILSKGSTGSSSCRNNHVEVNGVALRVQGPWVPSLSHTRVLGSPPFFRTVATHAVLEHLFLWQLGSFLFGLPAQEF